MGRLGERHAGMTIVAERHASVTSGSGVADKRMEIVDTWVRT
jgi:hypothetical protein